MWTAVTASRSAEEKRIKVFCHVILLGRVVKLAIEHVIFAHIISLTVYSKRRINVSPHIHLVAEGS